MLDFRMRTHRLLPVVLGLVLLPAGFAADSNDIHTGEEETPEITPASLTIQLAEQTKQAGFGIDTRQLRVFRINTQSGGVQVSQDARAVEFNTWYYISRALNFTVLVRDPRSVALDVEFVKLPAKELEKLARAQDGNFGQMPAAQAPALERAPKIETIVLAQPPVLGGTKTASPSGFGTGRLILYTAIFIAAAIGIFFVLRRSIFRETEEEVPARAAVSLMGRFETAPPAPSVEPVARPPVEPPPVPVTPPYVKQLESQLEAVQQESRHSIAQLNQTIQIRVQEIEERLPQEPADRADLDMLRAELKVQIERLDHAIRQFQRSVEESSKSQVSEIEKLRQRIELQTGAETGRTSEAEKRLDKLLRVTATQLDTGGDSHAREVLAERLEQAVSDFFAQSVPGRDGLETLYQKMENLSGAIEQLRNSLANRSPDLEEKIQPAMAELEDIRKELDGLMQVSDTKTLRLNFTATFYASAANRESLGTAIAAGIREQISKLDRPQEHFARRMLGVAASTAQAFSDFLDTQVDPQRTNPKLQKLLGDLVAAGGLEQIAPGVGGEFKAIEQNVVHMLPRPGGVSAGRSVARLVARGFRHNGEVLRKAAVILYE